MKNLQIYGENIQISDGFHTFDDLYEHRIELWITLLRVISLSDAGHVWKSRLHSDGSKFDGWFLLGIFKDKGYQMTYHLPDSKWEECKFAEILEMAPEFDGHDSNEVLKRLKKL